ncbi:MAG: hypothetical protein LBI37_01160 [Puniceicoccales bacterium]|jgi:hypothetical protein|nr:hypothetical protein [Puniceicoccales bacterium]
MDGTNSLENSLESRVLPVLGNAFRAIADVKVDMPKSCKLTTQIDGLYSSPEELIKKTEEASNAFTGNAIDIIFSREDGTRETVGRLITRIMLSHAKGRDFVVITIDSGFDKNFRDMESLVTGFDGILNAYVSSFREKNDTSYSVYFELCSKFFVSKLAIRLGFFPGWLDHAMASGKSYEHLKAHSLFLIDKFLAVKNCNSIPIDTLVSCYGKIERQDVSPGIVPQNWQNDSVTMVFYYPIWNRYADSEHMYKMEGDFWNQNAPNHTKALVDEFSKKCANRFQTKDIVLKIFSQN